MPLRLNASSIDKNIDVDIPEMISNIAWPELFLDGFAVLHALVEPYWYSGAMN